MKIIYCIFTNWFGENQFFFDDYGNLLGWWTCNDASWRHEYMNPMMKALGIDVRTAQDTDPRFEDKIQAILREHGATDEDFADE